MNMRKPIVEFEELYAIDETGTVWNIKRNKPLSPADNGHGYLRVNLHKNKKQHTKYIHRLLAEAFIPNPENLSEVDHINADRQDNRLENLRWVTSKQNYHNPISEVNHLDKHIKSIIGISIDNPDIKIEFKSLKDAANYVGLKYTTAISNCLNNRSESSAGYRWYYKNT